jgi:DNA-binding winged helix-turn-helix (wHTH) protein
MLRAFRQCTNPFEVGSPPTGGVSGMARRATRRYDAPPLEGSFSLSSGDTPLQAPNRPTSSVPPESQPSTADSIYALEEYEFDLAARRLWYRGVPIALEPKVAAFLASIVGKAGDLVTREELRSALWEEGTGSDDTLNYVVSRARHALIHCSRPAVVLCRGRGYRLGITPAPVNRSSECPGLVERRAELGQLNRALALCAASRQCRLMLVTGSAGVGKTMLIEQFVRGTTGSGRRVAWGRCVDVEVKPPLWPWRAILDELCPGEIAPSSEDPYACFASVGTRLARVGDVSPLVVVLEDIQWADEATLALLEFVEAQLTTTPLLLVVTCRTPVAARRTARLDGVARNARVLSLDPLSAVGAKRLLRQLREPMEPSLECDLLSLAEGNPSILVGAVRALPASPTELDVGALLRSPSAICNGVRYQLSALRPEARSVLTVAAVVGLDCDAQVLALVLGLDATLVVQHLSQAVELEIMQPCTATEYRFVKRLCREYLYRQVADPERRSLHWKIGIVMRALEQGESPGGLALIALHLSEGAVSSLQASEAARVVHLSGHSELRRNAPDAAATAFALALRLAARGGWPSTARAEMALVAAGALRDAGAVQQALRLTEHAMEITRAREDWKSLGAPAGRHTDTRQDPS